MENTNKGRLLRIGEVKALVGMARSTIYRMMKNGEFPLPVKIGPRMVRWLETDINDFVEAQPRATGNAPP